MQSRVVQKIILSMNVSKDMQGQDWEDIILYRESFAHWDLQ